MPAAERRKKEKRKKEKKGEKNQNFRAEIKSFMLRVSICSGSSDRENYDDTGKNVACTDSCRRQSQCA